jgi:hypothetical protein
MLSSKSKFLEVSSQIKGRQNPKKEFISSEIKCRAQKRSDRKGILHISCEFDRLDLIIFVN